MTNRPDREYLNRLAAAVAMAGNQTGGAGAGAGARRGAPAGNAPAPSLQQTDALLDALLQERRRQQHLAELDRLSTAALLMHASQPTAYSPQQPPPPPQVPSPMNQLGPAGKIMVDDLFLNSRDQRYDHPSHKLSPMTISKPLPLLPPTISEVEQQPYKYHDASLQPDPVVVNPTCVDKFGNKALSITAEPFPQKLHRMLTEIDSDDEQNSVASFLPHGRAFMIHDPDAFVKNVMPKYFRMRHFSSFQRQLNLYSFHRITIGRDKGAYFHHFFLKGRPALTIKMKRTKIRSPLAVSLQPQQQQPQVVVPPIDFYSMPAITIPPKTQVIAPLVASRAPTNDDEMDRKHQSH